MNFDLVVVGGGSGGVRGARMSASLGARVALVEAGPLGGTCVNVGCIPKKLLSYGAQFAHDLQDMRSYGWSTDGARFDWPTLLAAKDREILRLNGAYRSLLDKAGVEVVQGSAVVLGPTEVRVGESALRTDKVLLATGGRPWRPSAQALPGVELTWTSDDLFALPSLPARLVIVGGGYVACEFASILSALGVEVRVLLRHPLPLRGFDEELRAALAAAMTASGVQFVVDVPTRVQRVDEGLVVSLASGESLATDGVLLATGRVPNTRGLEPLGLALGEDGAVVVDDHFQTSVPGVFAVGDLVSRLDLTPVALAEAMVFAYQQFGGAERAIAYESVPTAVFTHPQLATVGLTEEQARARFSAVDVYASQYRPLKHTLTGSPVRSMVKVVVDRATDRVLGVHVLDESAAEIVQGFAVAVSMGATKAQLDATIGIHPTAAEELVTLRTAR